VAVNLHCNHFRFGKNELAENTHGWYAAEDVSPSHTWGFASFFLLRLNEQETGGTAAADTDATFQYQKNGGTWTAITTTSANVKAVNGVLTNGGNCTKRLSGTGTFETTGAGQTEDGTSGGSANDIAINGCSETECALQFVEADLANGDIINFRIISPDWTVTMDVAPTISVVKSVTPGVSAAVLVSYAPTVALSNNKLITPPVSDAVLVAYALTVAVSDNKVVTPSVATANLTSFIPAVVLGTVVTPGLTATELAAYEPTVSVSYGTVITPSGSEVTLVAYAPSIAASDNIVVAVGLAEAELYSFYPTVTATEGLCITPSPSTATLVSFAPTATRTYTIVRIAKDRYGPLAGAEVYLFDTDTKTLQATTTTGSDGIFRFPGHCAGQQHFAVLFSGTSPRRAGVTPDTVVGTE